MHQEFMAEVDALAWGNRMNQLSQSISATKAQQNQELLNKISYKYMIERMKKDLISIRIKINRLEYSLSYRNKLLTDEIQLNRKVNEEHIHAKKDLTGLMDQVDEEQKKRQQNIINLRKKIKVNEEAAEKRLERFKRRQDIAEAAAADNNDQSERKLREKLLVKKFWNGFLKRKMEREMSSNVQIEEAFKRIKSSTGIQDIQEIVRKFLSREQIYNQLLISVNEYEKKIEAIKSANSTYLQTLGTKAVLQGEQSFEDQIKNSNREISSLEKTNSNCEYKHQNYKIVFEQVEDWGKKVRENMVLQLKKNNDLILSQKLDDTNLKTPLEIIKTICEISIVKAEELFKESKKEVSLKNFLKDFENEDYIEKIKRTLPSTSKTSAKLEAGKSNVTQASILAAEKAEKEVDKEIKEMHFELSQFRKKTKQMSDKIQKKEEEKRKKAGVRAKEGKEEIIKDDLPPSSEIKIPKPTESSLPIPEAKAS